jgi:hypothetical protein
MDSDQAQKHADPEDPEPQLCKYGNNSRQNENKVKKGQELGRLVVVV